MSSDPLLPDSIFTWRFEATGGARWGGTLVADTTAFNAGDTVAGSGGTYTIVTEDPRGTDLTSAGLEDRQVFVAWYWDAVGATFLPTRNGPFVASGSAGLGSERDDAWTGLAWAGFGLGGQLVAQGAPTVANARFTFVFEADSGDRWGGVLFDLDTLHAPGATLRTAHGTYRITAETALAPGGDIARGTVRLTGTYLDGPSGRTFTIEGAGGTTDHGTDGLGSEIGRAFDGAAWTFFGQGGALQIDPPAGAGPVEPRQALAFFGANSGGWSSQDLVPRMLGDLDADGRADIVGFGETGVWRALAGAGGNLGPAGLIASSFGYGPSAGWWSSQDRFPRTLADVNGDGRVDIVAFGEHGVWMALTNGAGGFDGTTLIATSFGFGPSAGWWTSLDRYPRVMADVNGDGRADIVAFGEHGVWLAVANSQGRFGGTDLVATSFGFGPSAGWWTGQDRFPRNMADVNGDGRADIVAFGEHGVWVALANNQGRFDGTFLASPFFGFAQSAGGWTRQELYPRMLGDINGDGRADIVGFHEAGTWAALARPDGSFGTAQLVMNRFGSSQAAGGWTSQDAMPRALGDLDGNGRAEVIGFAPSGTWTAPVPLDLFG